MPPVQLAEVAAARERLHGVILETPLLPAYGLQAPNDIQLWLNSVTVKKIGDINHRVGSGFSERVAENLKHNRIEVIHIHSRLRVFFGKLQGGPFERAQKPITQVPANILAIWGQINFNKLSHVFSYF